LASPVVGVNLQLQLLLVETFVNGLWSKQHFKHFHVFIYVWVWVVNNLSPAKIEFAPAKKAHRLTFACSFVRRINALEFQA
jgi:hypothetical protein